MTENLVTLTLQEYDELCDELSALYLEIADAWDVLGDYGTKQYSYATGVLSLAEAIRRTMGGGGTVRAPASVSEHQLPLFAWEQSA